ncbi:hypothetical protein [Paenibacillus macerans]|uniref:ATP-dependent DNA ligase n=1 Tax=Paenibacillus macerans TaxID=44252 RepID=UPI003D313D07
MPAYFAIFDIQMHNGRDLRRLPLTERKEILATLQLPNSNFGIVPHIVGAGEDLFEEIKARGMEGVVGKRGDSVYETGRRSDNWRKVINWTHADVYITGYRKAEFGWQVLRMNAGECARRALTSLALGLPNERRFTGLLSSLSLGRIGTLYSWSHGYQRV